LSERGSENGEHLYPLYNKLGHEIQQDVIVSREWHPILSSSKHHSQM